MKGEAIARFRVYGHNSSLYFLIYVWRWKKDMLANRRAEGLRGSCDAHTYVYDLIDVREGQARRKKPIVGEIHFHKARLGTEAVTHETLHATAALLRRLKFDFSKLSDESMNERALSAEELFAGLQGKMARAIVTKFYDLQLL